MNQSLSPSAVQLNGRGGENSAALTAVGLDEEDDQEHSGHQDEQQAGHKAEIIGFHGWIGNGVKVSLPSLAFRGDFIGRCG